MIPTMGSNVNMQNRVANSCNLSQKVSILTRPRKGLRYRHGKEGCELEAGLCSRFPVLRVKGIASVCNKLQKLSALTISSVALGLAERKYVQGFSNGGAAHQTCRCKADAR